MPGIDDDDLMLSTSLLASLRSCREVDDSTLAVSGRAVPSENQSSMPGLASASFFRDVDDPRQLAQALRESYELLVSAIDITARKRAEEHVALLMQEVNHRANNLLSMAWHELATNAGKYGALSNATGKVHLQWQATGDGDERLLHIRWSETDGPSVTPPERFGLRPYRHGSIDGVIPERQSHARLCAWGPVWEFTGKFDQVRAP